MNRGKLVEGEVFRNEHFVVTRETAGRLFRLRRTTIAIDDQGLLEGVEFFERFLPLHMRLKYVILLDSRDAPMAKDRQVERKLNEAGARILAGFAKAAVLVQTAEGKLQASRTTRDSRRVLFFTDENEALGYLLGA